MKAKSGKEGSYGYLTLIGLLVVVVTTFGFVPSLAKLGDLPGDLTTLYVNWFAVPAVAILIAIQNHGKVRGLLGLLGVEPANWQSFGEFRTKDYLNMVWIGAIWPLAYSIAYFGAVDKGGGGLTTILNYTWPVFSVVLGYLLFKKRQTWLSFLAVVLASGAIAVTRLLENEGYAGISPSNLRTAILLGLVAAACQGFYYTSGERWKYNPWVMTLIIEIVTAVGASVVVFARGGFFVPEASCIAYLAIIGVISNGIGFWAFLAGRQKAKELSNRAEGLWLTGNCLTPFAATILLPLIAKEEVRMLQWIGVSAVTASLLVEVLGNHLLNKDVHRRGELPATAD